MTRSRFTLIALAIIAIVVLALFMRSTQHIETVRVTRGTAVEMVYATGVVEAVTHADVAPEVNGRIVERYVDEGVSVRQGDALARLFDAEQSAEVAGLTIRVSNDEVQFQRAQDLLARRVGSKESFDNAKAELEQSRALLAAAQVRLQQRTLRAPIDGMVLRREGEIGETYTAGQTMFVIGLPKPLRVTVDVDEEDIPLIKVGQTVLLSNDGFPAKVFEAKVSDITLQGDSDNKTYRVRAILPDDAPLPVGMTVEANLVVREVKNALLLPTIAITEGRVVLANRHVANVKTGIRGPKMTQVLEGLNEGDEVMISPSSGAAIANQTADDD